MRVRAVVTGSLVGVCVALLIVAAPAAAKRGGEEILRAAKGYPGQTTYSCRTDAITIHPGQNINEFDQTSTCPHAKKIKGPGGTDVFDPGSDAEGYVTRFKPSMIERRRSGRRITPAVYDLHLHHVVWIPHNTFTPTFAAGEEKTIPKLPKGYGLKVGGAERWTINQMIHNLNETGGRKVFITWEIDWVPERSPARDDISPIKIRWMDVAGAPQIYPVFDAERGFDTNGDGDYVFPNEVPTNPAARGFEERRRISRMGQWTVAGGPATLVFGAGHLHPGGTHVDLQVARDGPDAGSVDGDDPSEVRQLFRSKARYYEPAGAVSWDVSIKATRPEWRIRLKPGDTVSISATYDVSKASWYESMGILPLAWTREHDPLAKDPFKNRQAVRKMYRAGGILTHGRLKENIDKPAGRNLRLPDPRKLRSKGRRIPSGGVKIRDFRYSKGGYSATRYFPKNLMRPPVVRPGSRVLFTNLDARQGDPLTQQVWHSITSCKAPCNRGAGIGYPLARGPIKFDSGQLGFAGGTPSEGVVTNSDTYRTPPLSKRGRKRGKTYTYFCRIHPFMRGSVRVKGKRKNGRTAQSSDGAISSGALAG